MRLSALCLLPIAAAGCSMDGSAPKSASALPRATAALMLADGTPAGTATLTGAPDGIRLVVDARGLPPGVHGLHVHATGACDGPDFKTAGGHWNPMHMVHGKDAPGGPHAGDLPNLTAAADGTGHAEATIPGAMLTSGAMPLLDADGAAIVIHAAADDYRTDPSGNSGARIACGVVKPD